MSEFPEETEQELGIGRHAAEMERRKRIVANLKRRGFDQTYAIRGAGIRPKCSQCESLVINGIACHEKGCPNARS